MHAIAGMAVLGYGLATGRFGPDQIEQYVATWRGEKLVPPVEEVQVEEKKESPRAVSARIAEAEIEREISVREVQMHYELLRKLQITIKATQAKVDKESERLQVASKQFDERLKRQQEQATDEGFKMALSIYSKMDARLVKEDLMTMTNTEAVRYLSAMKSGLASDILSEFKGDDAERQKRVRLVQLLETYKKVAVNK